LGYVISTLALAVRPGRGPNVLFARAAGGSGGICALAGRDWCCSSGKPTHRIPGRANLAGPPQHPTGTSRTRFCCRRGGQKSACRLLCGRCRSNFDRLGASCTLRLVGAGRLLAFGPCRL